MAGLGLVKGEWVLRTKARPCWSTGLHSMHGVAQGQESISSGVSQWTRAAVDGMWVDQGLLVVQHPSGEAVSNSEDARGGGKGTNTLTAASKSA